MKASFLNNKKSKSVPLIAIETENFDKWLKKQSVSLKNWVKANDFTAKQDSLLLVSGKNGDLEQVLVGIKDLANPYHWAGLAQSLPSHTAGYVIKTTLTKEQANAAALGWALGGYSFTTYKKKSAPKTPAKPPALVWPEKADRAYIRATDEATTLVRDLVNIPANDLGPAELLAAARKLAKKFTGTTLRTITGKDLLKKNYPAVYEVGKGSPRAPRLVDLRWGKTKDPLVTLVGKGVCFDTGGLDIKPSSYMLLMKKDMGGAAHVLGLAHMIMALKLPVRLRVLIPAVENSVDGNSFRPGDVIKTRKGLSVEVGNTDAEGRLVLADALTEAASEKPDIIIDYATLTGSARVALGPDLPAMFSNDDKTATELQKISFEAHDPVWQLPLWQPYISTFASKIADTNSIPMDGMAGAITAALFLEKFVEKDTPWVHLDTFAWNGSNKPGRPYGGEALGMRAVFDMLNKRYGRKKK